MADNPIKSIAIGVTASVIAGIILLTIPSIRLLILSILSWLWKSLIATYSVSGYFLILLSLSTFVVISLVFLKLIHRTKEPRFKSYTEDFMRGTLWKWNWVGSRISNIWCYCPYCDATLIYDDSSCYSYSYMATNRTNFICENCSNRIITSIEGGNKEYVLGLITREVDRRIRTEEYTNLINNESEL